MRLNKFFMGVLGALALTACSSEEIIPDKNGPVDEGKSRFMKVSIRNAFAPTRADGYFEDGFNQENKVKNIIFYFFDKDGNAINVVNGDKNYFICTGENGNDIKDSIPGNGTGPSDKPNAEKILNTTIVLSNGNSSKDNLKELYSMVAILNYDGFITPKNMNLTQLKTEADNYAQNLATKKYLIDGDKTSTPLGDKTPTPLMVPNAYTTSSTDMPYFVMTSSSYLAEEQQSDGSYQKVPTFLVKNIASHVRDKDTDASKNPVDIYVERLVAKVRLSTDWDKDISKQIITFNGKNYEAIALKDSKGNNMTTTVNGTDQQIYVIFEGWGLQNTAQTSWLFKQVYDWKELTGWGDGTAWNNASYFRSYWAYNHTDVKPKTLMHLPYEEANGVVGTSTTPGSFFYCLENAGDDIESGKKKLDSYNPDTEISPRTQVFIKAKLITIGEDGPEILKLAEWGGSKYAQDGVIKAMLGTVNNDIFIRKFEKKETLPNGDEKITYSYISIPESMVTLISGLEYGHPITLDHENDKRYLSYLKLKSEEKLNFPEGYEKAFFKDKNGTRFSNVTEGTAPSLDADIDEVNALLRSIIGAKVWEDGKTYYYTDLKHLGTKEQNGLYGVVRNHIYDVKINTITGLGTPVLNPSEGKEVIITQHPGKEAFFLGARVNILSWRVVNNNTSLNW